MRQQSFRHRGKKSGSIGGGVVVVLLVAIGAFLVYQLILWFRSSNAQTVADENAALNASTTVDASGTFVAPLNSTLVLRTSDGSTAGTVVRSGTAELPQYALVANLVALPPDSSYEVWLVKDGLADVKSAGTLLPRADGSWVESFTAKDPLNYPTLVIMLEPNDGNDGPSGNRVAEGRFE